MKKTSKANGSMSKTTRYAKEVKYTKDLGEFIKKLTGKDNTQDALEYFIFMCVESLIPPRDILDSYEKWLVNGDAITHYSSKELHVLIKEVQKQFDDHIKQTKDKETKETLEALESANNFTDDIMPRVFDMEDFSIKLKTQMNRYGELYSKLTSKTFEMASKKDSHFTVTVSVIYDREQGDVLKAVNDLCYRINLVEKWGILGTFGKATCVALDLPDGKRSLVSSYVVFPWSVYNMVHRTEVEGLITLEGGCPKPIGYFDKK